MVKINDTTTFPITAPALDDLLLGTDRSNTGNDANGETVNFTVEEVSKLVPATELLATLTPTSGTSISATGLDLTGYRKLFISYDTVGVSDGGGAEGLSVAGSTVWSEDIATPGSVTGVVELELVSGVGFAIMQRASAQTRAVKFAITNVTTSITFTTAGFSYSSGTIRVFGER